MKQFVLDSLEAGLAQSTAAQGWQRDAHGADLMVDLRSGRKVAIYIINRAIRVPEITATLSDNTRRHTATLYIVDGRMVPSERAELEPPQWMAVLHALANGRVYAYWCQGRECTIRPVHLEWRWGNGLRAAHYGEPVQISGLRAETVVHTSKWLTGRLISADFGEGAFWKKNISPQDIPQDFSWRNWSFGGRRQAEPEPEPEGAWDAFNRHYADVGSGPDYRHYRRRSNEQARRPRHVHSLLARYYALLGLTREASLEDARQAYRKMARENHPDLHPTEKEKYTTRMAEINAAFEAVSKQIKAD